MSSISPTSATSAQYLDPASMSPDALLYYCQSQLGSLDDEMTTEMNGQDVALAQRTAVQNVQTAFESVGTNGPQTESDLKTCLQAIDNATASLTANNPDDPVAQQLSSLRANLVQNGNSGLMDLSVGQVSDPDPTNGLDAKWSPDDWKSITDSLSNTADHIKSNAEIQMLKLQDVVSQRQQAVEEITGMMSKTDQTLESGAKAIGE